MKSIKDKITYAILKLDKFETYLGHESVSNFLYNFFDNFPLMEKLEEKFKNDEEISLFFSHHYDEENIDILNKDRWVTASIFTKQKKCEFYTHDTNSIDDGWCPSSITTLNFN